MKEHSQITAVQLIVKHVKEIHLINAKVVMMAIIFIIHNV